MIFTHEQVTGGEEYLGFARQKLAWLERSRIEAGAPLQTWGPIEIGSAEIYIESSDTKNLIRITGGISGFLFHPRSGGIITRTFDVTTAPPTVEGHKMVNGAGFDPTGGTLPAIPKVYPLVDNDHGTRSIEREDGEWTLTRDPLENYGNIDWKGSDSILTWKGPPSRYFPLNPFLEIPGLTELDYCIIGGGGDYSQHTPFRKYIYEGGEALAVAPNVNWPQTDIDVDQGGQVLGAAYCAGKLVLIVKAIFNTAPVEIKETRVNGYYYQAYMMDGAWVLLGELKIGHKPMTPFFFNQSGTEAQTVDGSMRWKVVIDTEAQTAQFSSLDLGVGQAQITATHAYEQTDESGDLREPMPMVGTNEVHPAWWWPWSEGSDEYADYIEVLQDVAGLRSITNDAVAITKTGQKVVAVDYEGDLEVLAVAEIEATETSTYLRDDNMANSIGGIWGDVKFAEEWGPAVHELGEIVGDYTANVGSHYTLANECKGEWSFSNGTIDDDGVITSITCGSPGSPATGTITYTNKEGSKSKTVRLYGGVYSGPVQYYSCETYYCRTTDPYWVVLVDGAKVDEFYAFSSNWGCSGRQGGPSYEGAIVDFYYVVEAGIDHSSCENCEVTSLLSFPPPHGSNYCWRIGSKTRCTWVCP